MKYAYYSLLALTLLSVGCSKPQSASNAKCVAGPRELCPSVQWLAEFHQLKERKAKLLPPQKIVDELNGATYRILGEVPKGYDVDEVTERFVLKPAVPVPFGAAQPAPQVPTTPAK